MVSKNFLSYSLGVVYKEALTDKEEDNKALVEEIHRLASDSTVFTKDEIKENKKQLKDIAFAVSLDNLVCHVDGGVSITYANNEEKEDKEVRAAAAFLVRYDNKVILEQHFPLPISYEGHDVNSHIAEYQALVSCLNVLSIYHPDPSGAEVTVYSDSENMVNQLNLRHRTRSENLRKLQEQALDKMRLFKKVSVLKIPREENTHADSLVKKELLAERSRHNSF